MTDRPRPLHLLRLVGSQAEMGAQHGAIAAHDAHRVFSFYTRMPERVLAGGLGTLGKLAIRTLADAMQTRLAKQRPAELEARTRAFAAAVAAHAPGVDVEKGMRAMATMDAMQNCVSLFARGRLGPFAKPLLGRATVAAIPACSTAIVWGRASADGELLFARNFDFPGIGVWDTAPAFVVCAADAGQRYAFFATRGADAPVVTVVNEAGLVFAPHTRWHADVTWGGATIVDLVHDLARKAESLDDVVRLARERPASSSWGIAVGSVRERAGLVLELAGPHVEVVTPPPGAEYVVCTNHYRSPAMLDGELAASAAWNFHSTRRERRLRALIEQRSAPLAPRDLARFLGDRRDPAAPEVERQFGAQLAQSLNVHAVVVAPGSRRAWVGVDRAPVCEGTWAEVGWEWDGAAGAWELGATSGSGFTAELREGFVAAQSEATRHVREAVRAFESDHDIPAARQAIERAIAAAPEDPSLRMVAAWLALEDNAHERAVAHVEAGLARETDPYRRGQLLLWGGRAARRSDPALARRWHDELARLPGDGLDELRARARSRHRGTPQANLLMVDAY